MVHLLGIDGSSMLVTAYYGNMPKSVLFAKTDEEKEAHYGDILHSSKGVYTNAILTMLKTIVKILKEQQPEHLVIAFDKTRNTFRRELYPDYKGQRKETPAPLKEQFILMEKLLADIGIKVLVSDTYEADDLIGSTLKKFENPEFTSYFLTKDHDYIQLINEYTRGWFVQNSKEDAERLKKEYWSVYEFEEDNLPAKTFEFTPQIIKAEFGHDPQKIVGIKAIGGDSSDNIPGIRGISTDTATKLLNEYDSLDGLYETVESCENEAAEKELAAFWKSSMGINRSPIKLLKEQKDMAFLCEKLATIKTDIPLDLTLEDCKTNINIEVLREYCEELELNSILELL